MNKSLNDMTPAEINREFAERAGVPWHEPVTYEGCSCGFSSLKFLTAHIDTHPNPNFYRFPAEVLKVMEARPDGKLFFAKLMYQGDNVEAIDDDGYIARRYITTPGLLAKAALQWMRERRSK